MFEAAGNLHCGFAQAFREGITGFAKIREDLARCLIENIHEALALSVKAFGNFGRHQFQMIGGHVEALAELSGCAMQTIKHRLACVINLGGDFQTGGAQCLRSLYGRLGEGCRDSSRALFQLFRKHLGVLIEQSFKFGRCLFELIAKAVFRGSQQ